MAPEQGSTVSFFPVDKITIDYLRSTGRTDEQIAATELYSKAQGLFRDESTPEPEFTEVYELDLSTITPAVAGPKMPHDRIDLKDLGPTYQATLTAPVGPKGLGLSSDELNKSAEVKWPDADAETIEHGAVVIAAITSLSLIHI